MISAMIKTFADKATAAAFAGLPPRQFPASIHKRIHDHLARLNAATTLEFLRSPPGNRLEKLTKDRAGQHSIRINDQWRICFEWRDSHAWDVEIVDYH
jgi:proteic killer suppression protein